MVLRRSKQRLTVAIIFILVVFGVIHLYSLFYKTTTSFCQRSFRQIPYSVYSLKDGSWSRNQEICGECPDFWNTTLFSPVGNTPIFIHNPKFDTAISEVLKRKHTYEPETSILLFDLLASDPDVNFIDIGANIGVHTLPIAQSGRKVLSVEALDFNVELLCASVDFGNLHDRVSIVYNALNNQRGLVNLGAEDGNLGGTFVDVDSKHIRSLKEGRVNGNWLKPVQTITFNDLLDLPIIDQFSKVFIKIDIEGSEYKAMQNSDKFFRRKKVIGVLMEWEFHRNMSSGFNIISHMTNLKFAPFFPSKARKVLDIRNSSVWPYDVLWLPKP